MPKPSIILSTVVLSALCASGALAQSGGDWPQWRGPDRDGISREAGWKLPAEDGVEWQADVGLGYSTVSVAGGMLYTVGHDKDAAEDSIYCLDAKTGKEVWAHTFDAKLMAKFHGGGSLTTPSIDGDDVYVSHREGGLFCFNRKSGKVKWQRNVMDDYDGVMPTWGLSASPLVLDEGVILASGPILAFSKKGKLLWKTKVYGHCYATPVDFEHDGKSYLACFTGDGLIVLARKTGKEVAGFEWETKYDVNAATPIVIDDKIFISSGYGKGCAMVKFDGKSLELEWQSRVMRNHMAGCVLHDGHLYGMDETTLKCIDLAGNEMWRERGYGKGALLLAGGKLLALSTRGQLVCAKATPENFDELARLPIESLREGKKWTTPVLCGGRLYLRNSFGTLVCVNVTRG